MVVFAAPSLTLKPTKDFATCGQKGTLKHSKNDFGTLFGALDRRGYERKSEGKPEDVSRVRLNWTPDWSPSRLVDARQVL